MASLEERIDKLTTAVETLTATLKAGASVGATASGGAGSTASTGSGSATTGESRGRGRPPKKADEPASKFTAEQVKDLMVRVKNEVSTEAAKEVISEAGADKLATLLTKPELWDKAMQLGTAALAPSSDGSDGLDEDADPDEI